MFEAHRDGAVSISCVTEQSHSVVYTQSFFSRRLGAVIMPARKESVARVNENPCEV